MGFFKRLFGDYSSKELKKIESMTDEILALEKTMEKLTDDELKNKTEEFRDRLEIGRASCRERV